MTWHNTSQLDSSDGLDPANAFCLIRNVVAQQHNNLQPNRQTEGSPKPSKNNRSDDTKARVQPELTFGALSHLLIVFLNAILASCLTVGLDVERKSFWLATLGASHGSP